LTTIPQDRPSAGTQALIGWRNAGAEIIAAVPDLSEQYSERQGVFWVVTAVRCGRDGQPREYVTWKTRTDQEGFYWGRYFTVGDGEDPDAARAAALADMARRARGDS
jgi:hypothetical protein